MPENFAMTMTKRKPDHGHQTTAHPTGEFMEEVAARASTLEEVKDGFPALWAHLQECEECLAAFTALLRLAHEAGHQERHSEEIELRRTALIIAAAALTAVTMLTAGFLFRQRQTEEVTVNRVYQRMSPAVANIQVKSAGVTGSGVVFDANGYVLTNHHVVSDAQNDGDIVVQLPGLPLLSAVLVGHDIATDLAVLQVDVAADRLTVAGFGSSAEVAVGDLAIAIGNPFGLSHSLTVGHISAVERRLMSDDMYAPDVMGVLQTDAAINPGNSGGPLFNSAGQVIGITSRIQSPSGGSVGLGFAIPGEAALWVAREIIAEGYVRRPFLGAGGRPVDARLAVELGLPADYGLLVQAVHPGSPAAVAGLRAGDARTADVILSVDGEPVRTQSDLNLLVAQRRLGDRVRLDIVRDGQPLTVEATLIERPREDAAEGSS